MNLRNLRKKQILELCNSLLKDYIFYLTEEEIKYINSIINKNKFDRRLMFIVEKIWDIELNTEDYVVVSWNKYNIKKKDELVTFATLNRKDEIKPFCNLKNGIEYKISYKSILGALDGDGATLIESNDKRNDYTIGNIGNKVINSYNGATKFITPKQLIDSDKYNELVLDSSLIKEKGIFSLEEKVESVFTLHKV